MTNYPPAPPPPRPTGKLLVRAVWDLMKQDPDLIWLPLVGALAAIGAWLLLIAPGAGIGALAGNVEAGFVVGVVLGAFAASAVGIYFQAALVLGAFQRADGYDPSFGSTLRQVWIVRRQVLEWAAVSTVVGTLIRAVEQRLGLVGELIGFLGGLAWAIATFFTVPVLVAEGLGPIAATKRSSEIIRNRWGVNVRSTLRIGAWLLLAVLGCVAVGAVGVALTSAGSGAAVIGVLVIVAAVLALLAVCFLASAVTTYARAMLYRFAVGLPVPGVPPALYAGVFVPKRGLRRRRWS